MTTRPPDFRDFLSGSGGPATTEEEFCRTSETKNWSNSNLARFYDRIFEELRSRLYPHDHFLIPRFKPWRGHRARFFPPEALNAPPTDCGEIQINESLIWKDARVFLQGVAEAITEIKVHNYAARKTYTEGYFSTAYWHEAERNGLAVSGPKPTSEKTSADYLHDIVNNGLADIAIREIMASGVIEDLRAMLPDPRNRPDPASRKTGKSRSETKNASKTAFDCPKCGGTVYGKPRSRVFCGDCSPRRSDNIEMVRRTSQSAPAPHEVAVPQGVESLGAPS